jgi:hypothetical protein
LTDTIPARAAVVLALALAAGCSPAVSAGDRLPHSGGAPGKQRRTVTNAQIDAWLAAVGRWREQPGDAGRACFLVTGAQVSADLAHPDRPWT